MESNESPFEDERSMQAFAEALQLIPSSERAAYDEAMATVPQLVAQESPAARFLQFTHGDPWAAAKRLALYWERRKILFGDRAFRSLTQCGNGALSRDDIEVLKSGFGSLLPPNERGQHIVVFDRDKLAQDFDNVDSDPISWCRTRIFFYLFSLL